MEDHYPYPENLSDPGFTLGMEFIRAKLAVMRGYHRVTYDHSLNVGEMSAAFARNLGLEFHHVQMIHAEGLAHDFGKGKIPLSILTAPRPLNAAERLIQNEHPALGEATFPRGPLFFERMREAARSHHERMDGSGYPDGLSGKAVPFDARVIMLADVFDAMTAVRGFNVPMTQDEAIADMLSRNKGGRMEYDPDLLAKFVKFIPNYRPYRPEPVVYAPAYEAAPQAGF